jgi:hypothetical protein
MIESLSTVAQSPINGQGLLCLGVGLFLIVLTGLSRRPPKTCPRCEDMNRPGAAYCAQCGHKLDDD